MGKATHKIHTYEGRVNSNHIDFFENPSGEEYDLDLSVEYSNEKEDVEFFSELVGDPVFDVYDEHDALCDYPIFENDLENNEYSFIDQFGDGMFDAKKNTSF